MDMMNSAAIVAVIALMEVIKMLINRFSQNKSVLTPKEQTVMVEMHKVLTARDVDGTPLCYVPRSWGNTQDKLIEALREISQVNLRQTLILERMEKILERRK